MEGAAGRTWTLPALTHTLAPLPRLPVEEAKCPRRTVLPSALRTGGAGGVSEAPGEAGLPHGKKDGPQVGDATAERCDWKSGR